MSESHSELSPDLLLDREAIEAARRSAFAVATHRPEDFDGMRRAGRLAAEVLDLMVPEVAPGVTTAKLDKIAFEYAMDHGALPACLGYRGYRHTLCTSINHVVCHGIPADRPLKDGDILNIDVTLVVDGWHGDTSRMYCVGEPSIQAKRLCDATYHAMWLGIRRVRAGAYLGDIGHAIQTYVEGLGYSVVREFCGHGIGSQFHEEPQVLHYGKAGTGPRLEAGMIFTIEPMVNAGKSGIKQLGDGWTVVTKDHSLSAQWEHTILVTETGFEVLTLSAGSPPVPA